MGKVVRLAEYLAVFGILAFVACFASARFEPEPEYRADIVDRRSARQLNGDFSYFLQLSYREGPGDTGALVQCWVPVDRTLWMRLGGASEVCKVGNSLQPCR